VRRKVDVILAANVSATVAAAEATSSIPVVMLAVFEPIGIGVIKSLERPGTNVTGTTMYAPQLIADPSLLPLRSEPRGRATCFERLCSPYRFMRCARLTSRNNHPFRTATRTYHRLSGRQLLRLVYCSSKLGRAVPAASD
jgi:hypothetical protein